MTRGLGQSWVVTLEPSLPDPAQCPAADGDGYLRLHPCAHCGSRERVLVDAGTELRGHCLRCAADLGEPLVVERLVGTLVVVPEGPAEQPGRVLRPTSSGAAPPPLVLIVDDDAAVREMFEVALTGLGILTIGAADGVEGFGVAHRRAPDAIVTDLVLPRLDGDRFIERLRDTSWGRNIPVVVFSGSERYETLDQPGVIITYKAAEPGPVLDHLTHILGIEEAAWRAAP